MGDRYNRQIRKGINELYKNAFNEVRVYFYAKAYSANFFQRLRMAFRYVFFRDFNVFL